MLTINEANKPNNKYTRRRNGLVFSFSGCRVKVSKLIAPQKPNEPEITKNKYSKTSGAPENNPTKYIGLKIMPTQRIRTEGAKPTKNSKR
ncbi:hypothetical protein PA25_14540 [Pseudoalteromonas sp. A25]|nr:hypothetical protein PA25_14540 [Pseudoalteromonas sp. A25]